MKTLNIHSHFVHPNINQSLKFNDINGIINHLEILFINDNKKTVYLLSGENKISPEDEEVFVHHNKDYILNYIKNMKECDKYYISYEYSYEDAYKMAITIKELSKLCYVKYKIHKQEGLADIYFKVE